MNTEIGYFPIGVNVLIYYIMVSIIGIIFFIKLKKDIFSIILFLIFYGGVFAYWSELSDNIHKIILLGLSVLLLFDKKTKYFNTYTLVVFFLFSIVFFVSTYTNKNPFLYSFSQYSKYLIPLILSFFIFNNLRASEENLYYLHLTLKLILLQVLFTGIKFFTIGFSESIVGSAAYIGGNPATFLPILGLLIIYSINDGKIKIRDIILLSSMLFISIMSFKRIIWFIYPIVLTALSIIWGRTKYLKYLFLLVPLIFYLGVRLNPTLNKEYKIWGSFDLSYALEFAQEYSGLESTASSNSVSSGRFAGNYYMIEYIFREISDFKTWFGYGPKIIYGIDYIEYDRVIWKWRVPDKGSLSGAARFLIAYGLFGLLLYLLFIFLLFYKNNNKKLRLFIIIFFLLEFFFYLDTLILPFLMIPLLLLSNYLSLSHINNRLNTLNIYEDELNDN